MQSRPVAPSRRQLGLTLLEVLVSLTLAGTFFAIALPAVVQSYTRLKLADDQGRALSLALSKAEELLSMPTGVAAAVEGRVDGFVWRVSRDDADERLGSQGERSQQLKRYRISVAQSGRGTLASISIQRLER